MARAALLLAWTATCGTAPAAGTGCAPDESPPNVEAAPEPSAAQASSSGAEATLEVRFIEALSVVQRPPIRRELEALDPGARDRLLRVVHDPATPPLARQRALSVLGQWPGDDDIAALFERVLRDADAPIARRVRMLRLLAESHAERAVPALRWAACQRDARLLAGTRRALGRLPDPAQATVREALERCAGEAG